MVGGNTVESLGPAFSTPKIDLEIQETADHNITRHASDDTRDFDIDSGVKDPLLCPDIANDLYWNLRSIEGEQRPRTDYMEKVQRHISLRARVDCVDGLATCAEQLSLAPETLHLAINYLDRYLSGNGVDEKNLLFVGLTCLMIASKYQEVKTQRVSVGVFARPTSNKFSSKDFRQIEKSVLKYLGYGATTPTTYSFLQRFVRAAKAGKNIPTSPLQNLECMATYIAELSLFSYRMLRFVPWMVAASAVFLAHYNLLPLQRPWNVTLQHYTHYRPSDLIYVTACWHCKPSATGLASLIIRLLSRLNTARGSMNLLH